MGITKKVVILLWSISCFQLTAAQAAKKEYPYASSVVGTVQERKDEAKIQQLKKDHSFKEKSHLVTSAKSQIRIELDAHSSLIIFENSAVKIPVITWGEGQVESIVLESGKIRYNCKQNCDREIRTPLSQDTFKNGEFLIEYDGDKPAVELTVIFGQASFRGLENENSIELEGGEKAVFNGIKENGEVVYDVLLRGRKVARGQLEPKQKLSSSEREDLDKKWNIKKDFQVVKVKKIIRTEKQICENPLGEFNQCAWICEGNKKGKSCDLKQKNVKCIRQRCSANGKWTDAQEMSGLENKCQAVAVVGPCDY
jgi:hypothetical protein